MLYGEGSATTPDEQFWIKINKWINSGTYNTQLLPVGLVPARSARESCRSGSQTFLNGCTMAHKVCFLQSRYPVYAEFLIMAIFTTAEMFDIGAHPGMPINVTAAISGTEYSGKWAASSLLVTCMFAAALGNSCLVRPLYFSLRVGSTRHAGRVVRCPVLYSYPLC